MTRAAPPVRQAGLSAWLRAFVAAGSGRRRTLLALSSSLLIVACGGSGDEPTTPPPANAPPAGAGLLEVSSPAVGQLTASWLPASDDQTAAASIRYQLHAGAEATFVPTSATLALEVTGQVSGTVGAGLTPGARYFVKLVALDEQGASAVGDAMAVRIADTSATLRQGTSVRVLQSQELGASTADSIVLAEGVSAPAVGSILASDAGTGYLRRVTGVSEADGKWTVQTAPASLSEVVSDIQLSSSVRMPALPASGQAAGRPGQPGLLSESTPASESRIWPATGFRYLAGKLPRLSERKRPLATNRHPLVTTPDFQIDPVTSVSGGYGVIRAPSRIRLDEAGQGEALLFAEVSSDSAPWFGSPVGFCKFVIHPPSVEDRDAPIYKIGVDLVGQVQLDEIDGTRVRKARQAFSVKPSPGTASAAPYKFLVTAYFEDVDRGCKPPAPLEDLSRPFGGWRDAVDFELTIYVEQDSFPSEELVQAQFTGAVEGGATGTFTVQNDAVVRFDPTLSFDVQLGPAGLESARLRVEASPMVVQTLTVSADARGTIKAEAPLIAPRTFYKVFVAPGGIPVVISGEFSVKVKVDGEVTGALKATEVFQFGFDRMAYGLDCQGYTCTPSEEISPVVNLKVGGEGRAEAALRISLLPTLTLTAYETLSGRITLEPYAQGRAGVEGLVAFESNVDPEAQLASLAFDADYRLTSGELAVGLNAYVYADFSAFDSTWFAWPEGAVATEFTTHRKLSLAQSTVAGLPRLSASADIQTVLPSDPDAIKVTALAEEIPNPLKPVFPGMPATLIEWQRWTTPKILAPVGTPEGSYGFVQDIAAAPGEFWVKFTTPGTYIVRLGGFGSWGTWARQYVDIPVTVTDTNGNGILDHVETRQPGAGLAITSVACSTPYVGLSMTCSVTGTGLPNDITFNATNCDPDPMRAVDGGTASERRFECTPVAANVQVAVTYVVPGLPGIPPAVEPAVAQAPETIIRLASLNDTGISSAQCIDGFIGPDGLVACSSPGAQSYYGKQDGMIGRDVTVPSNLDGRTGFSFAEVPRPDGGVYSRTECVRDQVTGLTWEGKEATGFRSGSAGFTYLGDGGDGEATAYRDEINRMGLCGHRDWRIPHLIELHSIVNYGAGSYAAPTVPSVDANWFPNTDRGEYFGLTGLPVQVVPGPFSGGNLLHAGTVNFADGSVRGSAYVQPLARLRLVRP